ncbi:BQ5605_C005g03339 [Microbotryum silenes-dioicae]|uniref:BQ5605_C005g03339 protein n=1 Tax=Microbotryum silenes-dioicae TaxID=796604 RepID=A0A2X0MEK2_9BASI|nr:BQ5605_C005g03339 [Microbotryum silenes-dioicae]
MDWNNMRHYFDHLAAVSRFRESTIRHYASAFRFWSLTHGLEGNADRIGLDMVYKAAKNISPLGKAPRRPFELPDLDCLIRLLEVSEPEDLAVIACAATSFYGMARIGELTVSSPEDPSHPPITPSTVRMHPSISALRDFIAPQSGKGPCPYNLLSLHLQTNPPQDQPLFSYQSKGRWVPLTRSRFLSRVNQTLKAAMV